MLKKINMGELILLAVLTAFNLFCDGGCSSWTVPEIKIEDTGGSTSSFQDTYDHLIPPLSTATNRQIFIPTQSTINDTEDGISNDDKEAQRLLTIIQGGKNRSHSFRDEGPYFDSQMQSIQKAYLGKAATLTCLVHDVKNPKSVTWIRSQGLRILSVGKYTYASDLRFEAMHSEDSNEWVLRIRSVKLSDQGKYECQITTKPIKTFSVSLTVVEPTVEIMGAPDIFVNKASMLNLTCIVYHAPNPPEEITWYHRNKSISYTSPRGGVSVVEERGETTASFLLLQNARASDSGIFTCHPSKMKPTYINVHVLNEGEHPAAMQTNSCMTLKIDALLIATTVLLKINIFLYFCLFHYYSEYVIGLQNIVFS